MRVILFGFKGCGKTHFGQLFAGKFGLPFIDTDALIDELYREEQGQSLPLRAIYQHHGATFFRQLEERAILKLMGLQKEVIALGGGAVLRGANVELLKQIGQLVYLEVGLETVKKRGMTLLEGDIETLYFQRLPIYRSINAPCIRVDQVDEQTVLDRLYCIYMEKKDGF